MTSSIFYKFKNSRDNERIVFNGTDLSVWELKKEIISASGLGDGTDFNLHIYPQDDANAEYKDDTTLIPRSSTVIAIRRPAPRGQGRAARYVTGKPPVRAITTQSKPAQPVPPTNNATPEDAEAAFLAESAMAWDAQKEALSHAKPVYRKNNTKNVVVPSHPPPPGYVCRRCNIKGHWIQACPTNDDPDFKPVFQAKRTTGIPQSFLKKVEKPVDEEAAKGVMLNADGEYVQVMTDTKTWDKFQEKTNASRARAASADAASKELRDRGLECPIDNQRFVDPVKTPCCGKTYCRECIDNALADGDLVCPNCAKEDVLMDDLIADDEMVKSLKAYDAEKAAEKEKAAKAAVASTNESVSISHATDNASPPVENDTTNTTSTAIATTAVPVAEEASDTDSTSSKKRKQPPTDIKPPTAPKAMRQAADPTSKMEQDFIQQMEMLKNAPMGAMGMPMNMNMPMPMPMPMQMQMPTQMGFQNAYPMGFGQNQQQAHGGQQQWFPQQNFGYGQQQQFGQQFGQQHHNQQFGWGGQGQWGGPGQQDNNDAYDRQPVNPRGRNRRSRAPDFRYL
ncbi:Zinc knuckle domain containing protein [Pyrenophora tritici-repentis]|uniref:Zinc knuckle domain containing protein n=2 Tax=Pyrenophora tritici-repentis TaxID=45151 RepID=A0A922STJ5_9PLEO|nr:zinc knuckle domain containing protein [Pyrenophora tritici-repentis Pt-1C-BFP]EDU44692.1 zinc knuckle domain containing protein [Pyrenophora tritici-repentis Pt-1C-BFP]KAI1517541.1 Zinc knuckle domain containing protein [Pyrenophora tritici-repentis]KAI1673348.1 Zinc knuckle domain containing protein [Pyrenophora tritici-repentis]KAI1689634.1 Zinc knuckle domain containing protein [Pyrenophora tritici-repentis]